MDVTITEARPHSLRGRLHAAAPRTVADPAGRIRRCEGLNLPPSTVAIAREFELEPADNARLASLCGPLDANLRLIEARLEVQIRRRGHGFRVQGSRAEAAERALRELHGQARTGEVSPEQVHLCIVEQGLPRAARAGERRRPRASMPRWCARRAG